MVSRQELINCTQNVYLLPRRLSDDQHSDLEDLATGAAEGNLADRPRVDRYVVTKRGKPVVVALSMGDYDALRETLDILADPDAMAGLRRGEADIRKGRTRSWKVIKTSIVHL